MRAGRASKIALALVSGIGLGLTLVLSAYDDRIPHELLGVWMTEHPKYQGLSFEITDSAIRLETADGEIHTYDISEFERGGEGQPMSYGLFAMRDGVRQQFFFFYTTNGGGEIRFKNQIEVVWKKASLRR
ncbi:MAG TPA: hypothetical protein VNO43_14040 [Candidatus Eisenbacteria bacterium]|nr:hypothetical protein [Candidatus Eisenbacteria bacterium]